MSSHPQIPEQFDIMVTTDCNACCPFCVQEATYKPASVSDDIFISGLREQFRIFYELGGRRVVITGGEPTLTMGRVLSALDMLSSYPDLVVKAIYTNGSRLLSPVSKNDSRTIAQQLKESGLGCVNLSVHDHDPADNEKIFCLPEVPGTEAIARHLCDCGLPFRFNLTLQQPGIENYEQFVRYVTWAFAQGAADIYVRDLFAYGFDKPICATSRDTIGFSARNRTNVAGLLTKMREDAMRFRFHAEQSERVRDKMEYSFEYLPAGKLVHLARLTIGTEDRDEIPYLIYMPDGRLYRGWLGEADVLAGLEA